MEKVKNKVGRPRLVINETELQKELEKYINKEQTAVKTYSNLRIGKTSFYEIIICRSYVNINSIHIMGLFYRMAFLEYYLCITILMYFVCNDIIFLKNFS